MTIPAQGHPDAQGKIHDTRLEALAATVAYAEGLTKRTKPRRKPKKTAPTKKRKKKP